MGRSNTKFSPPLPTMISSTCERLQQHEGTSNVRLTRRSKHGAHHSEIKIKRSVRMRMGIRMVVRVVMRVVVREEGYCPGRESET